MYRKSYSQSKTVRFLAHPVHGFCWKFTWLSSSNFENPLRIDKVIAMSSVCSFFWPTLYKFNYPWPWNLGQGSLKVTENDTIWKLGYGFLFAFHSNYGRISQIFSIKEWLDLEIWVWGRSRSFKMAPFDRPCTTFYWSVIVSIAPSCTIFEFFNVE